MFGIGKPRPPLSTAQRLDIELLMRRTIEIVGAETVRRAEIVTELDELRLDRTDPQRLLESADVEVRRRMGMTETPFDLKIVDGRRLGYPSTYKAAAPEGCSPIISVADDTAIDPLRTVMELAYQYSHHFWVSRPDSTQLDADPRTTHLLPVCLGLGVLASDASLEDRQWTQAGWSGWSISRTGYYNAVEIGYAMALWARARGESDPPWVRSLRLDSRVTARHAERFFRHQDAHGRGLLFDDEKVPSSARDFGELAGWLSGDDRAFALAAGYALARRDPLPPLVIQAALRATESDDRDLVPVAVRLLAGARHDSPELIGRVRDLIRSKSQATSIAALQTASALGLDLSEHRGRISKLLDAMAEDSFAILAVIAQQGDRMAALAPQLCRHLGLALKHCDEELSIALIRCLDQIVADPDELLKRNIRNEQIRHQARERWARVLSEPAKSSPLGS